MPRLQFTAGGRPPAVGPAYCQLAVVIFPLAHGPQHPKRRLSWLKKTNLKRRTDERQNTQREKHATAQRQRAHVHSSHAAHAAGAPFAAHPAPNRAGRPCRALLYVPRGVNLDLTWQSDFSSHGCFVPRVFTPPEATNTGPGFNRGSGGGARGCDFEERVGAYARTEGGRFL